MAVHYVTAALRKLHSRHMKAYDSHVLHNVYATDTAFLLTIVKFPHSFLFLISCQIIGFPRNLSQAIDAVYEYYFREMQACESMDLCAISFEIILLLIWINPFVKVLEDPIVFVTPDARVPILRRHFVVVNRLLTRPLCGHSDN